MALHRGARAVLAVVAPIFCAVVFCAACGGGAGSVESGPDESADSGAPDTVDVQRWSELVDQQCVVTDEEFADLGAARPDTAEEAIQHAEQVHNYARELRERVRDQPSPSTGQDEVERFLEQLGTLESTSEELLEATRAPEPDPDQVDAAAEAVLRAGAVLNESAGELDLPSCAGF